MSVVSALEIEMFANMARLRQDMETAKGVVGGAVSSIEKTFKGLGVALGAAAFGAWIKSAVDAADEAFNLSQKIGVAASDIGGLRLAFEQAGLTSNELKKTFALLSTDIANNSAKFKALGIDLRNVDGSAKSNIQVFGELADRFAKMKDGTDKTALAVEIFGKKIGPDLIPILNQGSAGLADMRRAADELGLTINDETASAADKFNDSLDLLKSRLKGVMVDALAPILPRLAEFTERMSTASGSSTTLQMAAKLLGGAFTAIVNIVLGVIGVFDALAIRIETLGKATVKFATGDFAGASAEIERGSKEIAANWNALFGSQQKALEETKKSADGTKAAYSESAERIRENLKAVEEAEKARQAALKASTEAYNKTVEAIDKALATAQAEIDAGGKLTDAKKLELDVRAKLNDATVRLTAAQKAEIETKLAAAQAALNDRDAQKAADEARRKLSESIGKQNEDLVKQIEAQQKANAESGLTTQQIARLEIQRLRDAAATAQQNAQLRIQSGINDEVTKEYQAQAENLRKLADEKEKGVHVEAAQQARDAWKETTKSIYDGLTDALMRAFESGKGFMDAFKSTLKNAFKTLVLEPTIRAVMGPVAGAVGSLFGGVANAAGGGAGGGLGILGQIGGLGTLGGVFGAGITGGLASYLGGASAVGGLMSGGFSALGSSVAAGSLSGIAASLGTLAGTLGPIALGIGLLVKGFSRGPKTTTETGIDGMIGGGEVDARQYSNWIKKGGWFRSDKRGTDYSALGADTAAALDQTARAVYDQSRLFAEAVGLSGDALSKVQTQIRVKLGQDEAANKAAIEAAFAAYREDLATSLGESLAPFQKAGETLADTLERLAQLATFSNDINQLGGIFSNIAALSVSAREELIGFAGGMEALLQKASSFVSSYYSQDEQFGLQARQIQKALESLGITAALSSRDDFRRLVESQDVSTTEGRKTFAALLDIAQAFAPVGQFLEQNKKSLDELAKAAPQVKVLESILEDAETQTEWAEKQAAATDRVYDGIVDLGDIFANAMAGNSAAIEALRASIEAGLAQVASNTNATNKLLDSWDNNGSMATTAVP